MSLSPESSWFSRTRAVDEGAAPVELDLALLEAPAFPRRALVRLQRAVERVREDRLGIDDRDAADCIDDLAERAEVDDDHVVHRQAGQRLHGLDRKRGPAEGVGGVDLVRAVSRDVDAQVARNRDEREPVVVRIRPQQHDRVGAPAAGSVLAVRADVGAEDEDVRRVREERARVGRERRVGGLLEPRVRLLHAAVHREVAEHSPHEDDQQEDREDREDDPAPAAPALPAALLRLLLRPLRLAVGEVAVLAAPDRLGRTRVSPAAIDLVGLSFPATTSGYGSRGLMVDREPTHSRLATATRRRLVALALTRAHQHGLRTITTTGLVAPVPDERAAPRSTI